MHEVPASRRTVIRALATIPSIIATPVNASATGLVCTPVMSDLAWRQAVSEYQSARRAYEGHPCGTTIEDHPMHEQWEEEGAALMEVTDQALDRVMEFPVTGNAMLLEKIEIAIREFGGGNFMDFILKDTQRLSRRM